MEKYVKKKKYMLCIKNKVLFMNIVYVNFMLFIINSYYYGLGKIDYNDGISINRYGVLIFFIKKRMGYKFFFSIKYLWDKYFFELVIVFSLREIFFIFKYILN